MREANLLVLLGMLAGHAGDVENDADDDGHTYISVNYSILVARTEREKRRRKKNKNKYISTHCKIRTVKSRREGGEVTYFQPVHAPFLSISHFSSGRNSARQVQQLGHGWADAARPFSGSKAKGWIYVGCMALDLRSSGIPSTRPGFATTGPMPEMIVRACIHAFVEYTTYIHFK